MRKRGFAAVAVAGVLVAFGASGSASGREPAGSAAALRQAVVPAGLLADLKTLNRKLTSLLRDVRLEKATAKEFQASADVIDAMATDTVKDYFGQTVYGVKFSTAFIFLTCVDKNLAKAGWQAAKDFGTESTTAKVLGEARKCAELLADKADKPLQQQVVALKKNIDDVIGDLTSGDVGNKDVAGRIKLIARAKQTVVNKYLYQDAYGVPLSETFEQLDCLKAALFLARSLTLPGIRQSELFSWDEVADLVAKAKRCKQKLESQFEDAAQAERFFTYAFSGLTMSFDGPDLPNRGRTHVVETFSGAGCGTDSKSTWKGVFDIQAAGVPPKLPWGATLSGTLGATPQLVYTWNTKDQSGTILGQVQTKLHFIASASPRMRIRPVKSGDIANLVVGPDAAVTVKPVKSCG